MSNKLLLRSAAQVWETYHDERPVSCHAKEHAQAKLLALNYLAEHPADDGEPATEEWLSRTFGPHLASCPWKRYALHFATDNFCRMWGWCPPCGNLPSCVCMNEIVILDEPTRGQILKLCAAMGMSPLGIGE